MRQRLHTTVHLEEGLVELKANIEQWYKSMAKLAIGFDGIANRLVEGAVAKARHKPDPEDLEQTADFILKIDALAQQRLAGRQEGASVMALDALHMHRTVPPGAQDLCDPARVVAVSLVAHGGERGLHLPGLQNDRPEARRSQPVR
jgi:hypothetical protein